MLSHVVRTSRKPWLDPEGVASYSRWERARLYCRAAAWNSLAKPPLAHLRNSVKLSRRGILHEGARQLGVGAGVGDGAGFSGLGFY